MRLITYSIIIFLLLGCTPDETDFTPPQVVRWQVDDESLFDEVSQASNYWQTRGENILPSNLSNTFFMVDDALSRTDLAWASWSMDQNGTLEFCLIRYNPIIHLYSNEQTRVNLFAHEFGHCLGYMHVSNCPDIMNPEIQCQSSNTSE